MRIIPQHATLLRPGGLVATRRKNRFRIPILHAKGSSAAGKNSAFPGGWSDSERDRSSALLRRQTKGKAAGDADARDGCEYRWPKEPAAAFGEHVEPDFIGATPARSG